MFMTIFSDYLIVFNEKFYATTIGNFENIPKEMKSNNTLNKKNQLINMIDHQSFFNHCILIIFTYMNYYLKMIFH